MATGPLTVDITCPTLAPPSGLSPMERLLEHAASLLSQHSAPALPLGEVEQVLRGADPPIRISGDALVRWLRLRTDLFLVFDPWNRITENRLGAGAPSRSRRRGTPTGAVAGQIATDQSERCLANLAPGEQGPWVVALVDPGPSPHPRASALPQDGTHSRSKLRECVVWASRSVDVDSTRASARWLQMVGESRELLS